MDEYEKRKYYIPSNFALEGKIFGNFERQNFIEAVVIFAAFLLLDILFVPTFRYKIYVGVACAFPAMFALMGVNGLPLSSFIADFLRYRSINMIFGTPSPDAILIRERQIIKEKHRITRAQEKEKEKEEKEKAKEAKLNKKKASRRRRGKQEDVFG